MFAMSAGAGHGGAVGVAGLRADRLKPHRFPESKRSEPRWRDISGAARVLQRAYWFVNVLGGHLERAEMHADALGCLKIQVRLHCLRRIHVNDLHEPPRLIGTDRQQRKVDWTEPPPYVVEEGGVLFVFATSVRHRAKHSRPQSRSQLQKEIIDEPRDAKELRRAPLETPTDLKPNAVREIACALTTLLADMFALYIKTKNFHWHVSGPLFRDYHLLLDEQAGVALLWNSPRSSRASLSRDHNLRVQVAVCSAYNRTGHRPTRHVAHDEMDLRPLARELRGEFHNNATPTGNAFIKGIQSHSIGDREG
jgi:hypothetical protein